MQLRVRCTRVSPFIVGEPGNMDTVAFAKLGEPGDAIAVRFERKRSFDQCLSGYLFHRIRDNDLLPHVPDNLICHQEYRYAVLVGKIECLGRKIIHFLDTRRTEGDDRVVPVRAKPALHHISLALPWSAAR